MIEERPRRRQVSQRSGTGRPTTTGRSIGTLHTRSDRKRRVTGTLSLDSFWAAIDDTSVDHPAK